MAEHKYTIIDVREPYEYESGHVEGAINIPGESLMAGAPELKDVPKDATLLVYCRTGSRSQIAMEIFRSMGYQNLLNGINQYIAKERFGV